VTAQNLRSAIDEITLEVAEGGHSAESLEDAIAKHALRQVRRLIDARALTDPGELDRVTGEIVIGVLKRLKQIAERGGQVGSARHCDKTDHPKVRIS